MGKTNDKIIEKYKNGKKKNKKRKTKKNRKSHKKKSKTFFRKYTYTFFFKVMKRRGIHKIEA